MKKLKSLFAYALFIVLLFPQKVFAEAYLEGDEVEESKSFLDGLDSDIIMANWYKYVIIAVVILCVIGLIVSNIIWYVKKRNK